MVLSGIIQILMSLKRFLSYRIVSDFETLKIKVTLENKNFQKSINYENILKPIYFDFDNMN